MAVCVIVSRHRAVLRKERKVNFIALEAFFRRGRRMQEARFPKGINGIWGNMPIQEAI